MERLRGTGKHGGGRVIVWICLSSAGVRNMVFKGETRNEAIYLNLFKKNLLQSAKILCIRDRFEFYQAYGLYATVPML